MTNTITSGGKHRVVVYGSLKRTEANHAVLRSADYLGQDTLTSIALYDLGPWPGARLEPSPGVTVEVYAVSLSQLARLDEFEDYRPHSPGESLYCRRTLQTAYGNAWVYLYNRGVRASQRLEQGSWHGERAQPRFRRLRSAYS